MPQIKLQGFYKHTNTQDEIVKNLEQAKKILFNNFFKEFNSFNSNFGGPLYRGRKNLVEYSEEEDFGGSYILNANRAQLYEVTMENTNGFAQYLSIILKGTYKQEVVDKLSQSFWDADFAPKNSYLGTNDRVITDNYGIKPLWLNEFVDFKSVI